ncbi:Sensor histidine kinase DesK [Microbacterium terrae]|uniref:histidine kinase n=2 Tax=Microbacterium terrae TaxID=69369 RepID=A0A0M2H4I4_9MICO|nr:Sensor histidine kinase DesK [Microbacterium terrae]
MTRDRRVPQPWVWVVVAVTAVVPVYAVLVPLQALVYGTSLPVAFLLGAGLCAAVPLAIRYPRASTALFGVSALALPLVVTPTGADAGPWPWSVSAIIAFALFMLAITSAHGWRVGLIAWVVGAAGPLVAPIVRPDAAATGAVIADLIVATSVAAAAGVVGALVAARIRVGEELAQSRELTAVEQSRRELVEERARIARELHDVVAHSMSVIQVQASTARYRLYDVADDAAAEFDGIAALARQSLTEMRRLLGVLRTDDDAPPLAPRQGIADIAELVDATRRAGVAVELSVTGESADPPPSVQLTAYRIVQEALSNAVRHAPGADIDVIVAVRAAQVEVRVHNGQATDAAPPTLGSGHGLRGMRERVALVAGSLTAEAGPDGGWTVTAVLPLAVGAEERG